MLFICWLVLRHVSTRINNPFSGSLLWLRGRDSSVGIATRYGLEGPGAECRWGRDFPHLSRPTLRPTQPPIQWVLVSFTGVKRPGGGGVALTTHPSSDEVKERVDIYLYYPSGPSWPLLGWIIIIIIIPNKLYKIQRTNGGWTSRGCVQGFEVVTLVQASRPRIVQHLTSDQCSGTYCTAWMCKSVAEPVSHLSSCCHTGH